MWPLRTIFYFSIFWIACALSVFNPIWGVVNYMFVYQMDPRGTWWGRPISDIGVRYSLYAIGFTMLGLIFSRRRVPAVKPSFTPWEFGLILLLAVAAVNKILDIDVATQSVYSEYAFEKLWKMFVFVFILGRLATTRVNLRIVIWTLILGSLYLGYDAYNAPAWSFAQGRLEYIGGADFSTTSGFAAHLTAMLPIIGIGFLTAKKWQWRVLAAVAGGFAINGVIMCRTRSAFIGLVMGTLCAFLWAPRARRWRIHALLIAGGLTAYTLTDDSFWTRMSTLTSQEQLQEDRATVTRIAIWKTSMHVLVDYPFGVGIGNFPRIIGEYNYNVHRRTSHNTVLVAFVELGLHGGLLFLVIAAGSMWYAFRCLSLSRLTDDPLETQFIAYGLLVSCVTYFVTGLGTERFLCESFWWVLALPMCLYRVLLREIALENELPALVENGSEPDGSPCLLGADYG